MRRSEEIVLIMVLMVLILINLRGVETGKVRHKTVFIRLWDRVYVVCMHGHHMYKSMDQPAKLANPARGQLAEREK